MKKLKTYKQLFEKTLFEKTLFEKTLFEKTLFENNSNENLLQVLENIVSHKLSPYELHTK